MTRVRSISGKIIVDAGSSHRSKSCGSHLHSTLELSKFWKLEQLYKLLPHTNFNTKTLDMSRKLLVYGNRNSYAFFILQDWRK